MVYPGKKGFTSQPVEQQIIPCTQEGTLQPSQLRFTPFVFICQSTPFRTLLHVQRMCPESRIKDEGIGDHQGANKTCFLSSVIPITAPLQTAVTRWLFDPTPQPPLPTLLYCNNLGGVETKHRPWLLRSTDPGTTPQEHRP